MSKKNLPTKRATILVAVDFSSHSRKALLYAAQLASDLKRPLQILHVVHDPGESPGYYANKKAKKQLQRLEERASEMFDEFLVHTLHKNSSITPLKKAKQILVSGLPVTRILEIEKKLQPYMLVMGSQGKTKLAHLMLGSKAEQVVQLSTGPITIIK